MIKLDKPDIETIEIGNNIAIKTDTLQIVFSPEAALEFACDVRHVVKRRQRDEEAREAQTSDEPPRDHKCQNCGKSIGSCLLGFCSPECLAALAPQEQPPCSPPS
jgi:hypothetical protein